MFGVCLKIYHIKMQLSVSNKEQQQRKSRSESLQLGIQKTSCMVCWILNITLTFFKIMIG
jgi:hypothetical protein